MVDCPRDDIRDLLPDLVHDQLEAEARVRVEQHLVDCTECAAELELLRAMRATAFATPEVDAERIAAAVRSTMSSAGSESDTTVADGDVVPITAARGRGDSVAGPARAREHSGRRTNRSTRSPIPQGWRIAAAIALVAAGTGGYALTRAGSPMLEPSAKQARVAAASETSASASAPTAAATRGVARAGAPAPSPAAAAAASDLASITDSGNDAATSAASPLILGDAVNELSESDMQALLQSVDDLQAMPDLEPQQLPLLATVVEGAL